MFELASHLVVLLIIAAFFAGFVDAIAGGGGLIAMPALLLAGASPLEALATNKLQGTFGSGSAAISYARAGHVQLRDQLAMAAISALAGAGGAVLAHAVPLQWLRLVMPVVLVAVALFFAFKPGLTDAPRAQHVKRPRPRPENPVIGGDKRHGGGGKNCRP